MSLTSATFLAFLIVTFLLYWSFKNVVLRCSILTIASYAFYATASVKCAILLCLMTLVTYLAGNYIIKRGKYDRLVLITTIALNLAILIFFKYFNFFVDNFSHLFQLIGIKFSSLTLQIMMPAGLSFYTFMLISHLVDCKRNVFNGVKVNGYAFFAYISFFPHLIAGPIDRSRFIIPQLKDRQYFTFESGREAMWQILNGLFKKFAIADTCGLVVDPIWNDIPSQSSTTLIIAAFLYSIQIYCDFSGFSDMAIGIGKLFGLKLMANFNYPYFARNISEFWRKWHISLTSWFTEYVYIPLGGSRTGKLRAIFNTIFIFTLCGFWHGANWSYVLWGLVCGLMFVPYLMQRAPRKYRDIPKLSMSNIARMVLIFAIITLSWIIFRGASAESMSTFDYLKGLAKLDFRIIYIPFMRIAILLSLIMFVAEWHQRDKEFALCGLISIARPIRWIIYISLIVVMYYLYLVAPEAPTADNFIYQNF